MGRGLAADLEISPAQLVFDLLVALLDPVAQPVAAHNLGQAGRRRPRPGRLRVGLPRYTEFDVALRRIREMLTIIILAFIVVAIVVVIVGAWTTLEALSNGGAGVEVPLPTPSG
jgi:hypothetical protein